MKLIHQVIKIRSIRTSPSLINKLNNMEDLEVFLRMYMSNLDNMTKKVINDVLKEDNEHKENHK